MEKRYSARLACLVFIYHSLEIIKNMVLLALNCSKSMYKVGIFLHIKIIFFIRDIFTFKLLFNIYIFSFYIKVFYRD